MTIKKYNLLAGRTITKNGRSFAYIGNNGGSPTELDEFTRQVVDQMNALEAILEPENVLLTGKDLKNIFGPEDASEGEETPSVFVTAKAKCVDLDRF